MVKLVAELAPAKINLYLRVVGRRADGYHELDSIFLPIALADSVRLEMRPVSEPAVTLRCNLPALGAVESNLAARAAAAFMKEFGVSAHVAIGLEKRIPVGAGLGGGSSDAGAVLRMMAALCGIAAGRRLEKIAVTLGADVPFFLAPSPSRVRGIGERREPVAGPARLPLVLAIPPFEVPTAKVFAALLREDWSGPAPDAGVEEIIAGTISPRTAINDLFAPASSLFPEIGRLRSILRDEGALVAQMSGSGGAVFGIFSDAAGASSAADRVRARAPAARVIATASTGGETAFESGLE